MRPPSAIQATGLRWCAGLALVGYVWARRVFDREPR